MEKDQGGERDDEVRRKARTSGVKDQEDDEDMEDREMKEVKKDDKDDEDDEDRRTTRTSRWKRTRMTTRMREFRSRQEAAGGQRHAVHQGSGPAREQKDCKAGTSVGQRCRGCPWLC